MSAQDIERNLKQLLSNSKEWDVDYYTKVYEHLEDAVANGLDESMPILSDARRACERFENQEAKKRLDAKENKKKEERNRVSKGRKNIHNECTRILKQIELTRTTVWDNATVRTELNGLILSRPELRNQADELEKRVSQIEKMAYHVETINEINGFYKKVQDTDSSLDSLLNKIQMERERRERLEQEARHEFDQKTHDAETRRKENERRKSKQIEQKFREEEEQRKQSLLKAAQKRLDHMGNDIKGMMQAQSNAIQADQFNELQGLAKERQMREQHELDEFESQLFGSTKSKSPASTSALLQKRSDGVLKSAAKLKAQKQRRNEAKAEAEKKRQQKMKEVKRAKQQAEKIRMEQKLRQREEEEKARLEAVQAARAALDEDEDDTEDEKRSRAEARKMLMRYDGDIWTSAKTGNEEMLRRFFLVEGSEELLGRHNYEPGEGGRTLLHTACWYGYRSIVKFLLKLGANVNAVDSATSKTTPLMEAARAGRREISIDLIRSGADVFLQDAHGDTALHWAARRGWGGLIVAMIQRAEKRSEGCTRGIYGVENLKGRVFLSVTQNESIHALIQKELGVIVEPTREERPEDDGNKKLNRRSHSKKKALAEMNAEELEKALIESKKDASQEYQELQQRSGKAAVQGLADLGLDLDKFAYGKR